MFCTNCKMARAENWAPCPNCGAPSPLQAGPQAGNPPMSSQVAYWGNAGTPSFEPGSYQGQQMQQWQQPQQSQQQPPWQSQAYAQEDPSAAQMNAPQGQSLLPVPYQGGMQNMQPLGFPAGSLQNHLIGTSRELVPMPDKEQMLPALPQEEGIVYVPPMYTAPRAIIPRYRVISGVLSLLIVMILLCSGTTYYARATGRLQYFQQLISGAPPPSLKPTPGPPLPEPPDGVTKGPAYAVIISAVLTKHVDPKNKFFAKQADKDYVVSDVIHLIYSTQPQKTAGTIVTKWYTNNQLYNTVSGDQPIKAGPGVTGDAIIKYAEPCEGKVELYWNNQLAQTLYFVVRAA